MTDSIQVFHPGWRFTDSLGVPYSGAKMVFYDAGTTTLRTVYSNYGLSSSLGSTVYTDSAGAPVASSGSSTEVMVYTGSTAYKIKFTTSADVEIFTLDNIKGALDTSSFLTSTTTSTLNVPVVSTSATTRAVTIDDNGKLICANTSGANITHTLDAATTLGAGWNCKFKKMSASNTYTLARSGSDTFDGATSVALVGIYDEIDVYCDGTAFYLGARGIAAVQSEQETATSTAKFVSPGTQKYHASAAKAWARYSAAGTIQGTAYNVSSVTDGGTGIFTPNLTTVFSSANYAIATAVDDVEAVICALASQAAGSFITNIYASTTGAANDPNTTEFIACGDQ